LSNCKKKKKIGSIKKKGDSEAFRVILANYGQSVLILVYFCNCTVPTENFDL